MGLQEAIQNIWASDYTQKNPNKAYKVSYANEYAAVAAYVNGGADAPANWQSFSKLGKGLVEAELEWRKTHEPEPEPEPGLKPVYVADFETGDFSQINSQQESSAGRISLVDGVAWGGAHTAKTLIGPSDRGVAGSGSSYRTEMSIAVICQKYGWSSLQGHETWLTWDTFIEPTFQLPQDPNSWLLFTQFWTQGLETGSPCFAINVAQGQMYITLRGGTETNSNTRVISIGPVPLAQVLHWKVHHRWSSSSGGLVEVWRNGTPLVSDTRPNCAVGKEMQPEMKIGTYRSGADAPTRDSYTLVDNIKFWPSDPGGT